MSKARRRAGDGTHVPDLPELTVADHTVLVLRTNEATRVDIGPVAAHNAQLRVRPAEAGTERSRERCAPDHCARLVDSALGEAVAIE